MKNKIHNGWRHSTNPPFPTEDYRLGARRSQNRTGQMSKPKKAIMQSRPLTGKLFSLVGNAPRLICFLSDTGKIAPFSKNIKPYFRTKRVNVLNVLH
jgi:hypothetical protein